MSEGLQKGLKMESRKAEIEVINVMDVLNKFDITVMNVDEVSYERQTELVMGWCEEHNALYYSWEGAKHMAGVHHWRAIQDAENRGHDIVVMDYLS